MYTTTYANLYASVQGETNASAAYRAFADKAWEEGYSAVANLFLATSDAEAKHANDEWAILEAMGATLRPTAAAPTVGTTAQNLQAAFDGETYEYTVMYPGFLATALDEGMNANPTNAGRIFNLAMRAEQVHAGNYDDVLANLADAVYLSSAYDVVYRCPVCGEVVTARPGRCPICGADGSTFIMYSNTAISVKIEDASGPLPSMCSVPRNSTLQLGVAANGGAGIPDVNIVWTISDTSFANVDADGNVTIYNKSGIVVLIANDLNSGLSSAIVLRIT
jgi:rubrerythrin